MRIKDPEFILAIDVGQAADYTAMAGLKRIPKETGRERTDFEGTSQIMTREFEDTWHMGFLERMPLHTPYPALAERAQQILGAINGTSRVVVDATGVGRPVVDFMRHLSPIGCVITAGSQAPTLDATTGMWRVPKRTLVTNMQVHMQTGRFKISSKLPLVDVFVKEALAFKMKINQATGNMSFEAWRDGAHDDIILAAALGLWWGHQTRTGWQRETGPMKDIDRRMRAEAKVRFGFDEEK